MIQITRALFFGLAVLAAACTTTTAPASEPATIMPPSGEYTHGGSGFEFPEAVGAFTRIGIDKYDSSGDNVSVGYVDRTYLISATIYVYPAGEVTPKGSPPSQAHFKAVKADIEHEHPQATLIVDDAKVTLAAAVGVKSTYRLEEVFAGARRSLLSEAYLFGLGPWFVKYRFTYPEAAGDQATTTISEFMDSLSWP